jgi:integral membrane sensor domain MASE1
MDLPEEVWRRLSYELDHKLRAALICLLTAALAAQGTAAFVGEPTGGWFWLPPGSLWQQWATQGFNNAASAMALKGQPLEKSRAR